MKPVRDSIGLAADVCGILAFIGLSATGLVAWTETKHTFSWLLIGSMFVSFVVSPTIAYFVLKYIGPRIQDYRWRKRFPKTKELKLTADQLEKILVTNDKLEGMLDRLEQHARGWAKDAVITEISFYQEIDTLGSYYEVYIDVYSAWRKSKVQFSMAADSTISVDKAKIREWIYDNFNPVDPTPAGQPFFKIHPNWHDEVIRQYGPMELKYRKYLYINASTIGKRQRNLKVTDESTNKRVLALRAKNK
ncbi:MAG TPA: hypothetical protein VIM53_00230 [Candidatus Saccharimonadales bacterium]